MAYNLNITNADCYTDTTTLINKLLISTLKVGKACKRLDGTHIA